jgi:MFS family permease
MKSSSRYPWFVVGVFALFMLLHQSDRLLISPLTTPIMESFGINEAQMGLVSTGALVVGTLFYPLWGVLYDRFARAKLLALASFIWGSTTWLSAIAPSFPIFLGTRASTGIDDTSYPGLYSLISDYFAPGIRGKVIGLIEMTMPLGYLMGMLLALTLKDTIGWRSVFYITGALGIVMAGVIFFTVREVPRGQSEPELANLQQISRYKFDWKTARGLFSIPTLRVLFIQGFFGVFPWNVITFWFFRYLETERQYSSGQVFTTMAVAVLVLACGYVVGGTLGDRLFKRTPRGRALVSMGGVLAGAVALLITMSVPIANQAAFLLGLAVTALFMPFAAPNVVSTVFDITVPEVRSTALAVQYFIESAGAATAPLAAGLIAVGSSLHDAIILICVSTWLVCAAAFALTAYLVPRDTAALRAKMRARAAQEEAQAPRSAIGALSVEQESQSTSRYN